MTGGSVMTRLELPELLMLLAAVVALFGFLWWQRHNSNKKTRKHS